MFLNSITLVLQEILEAALLISVLLALTQSFPKMKRWIILGIFLGVVGAYLFGAYIGSISEWFDYVGQEIVSASMQLSISVLVALIAFLLNPARARVYSTVMLSTICPVLVMLSITREGAEIFLYLQGNMTNSVYTRSVLAGSAIGTGIGISIGVVLFYLLTGLSSKSYWVVSTVVLALIGGNMAAQAILLLTQADWITYSAQLWDSSAVLTEQSLTGRLLYSLVGYEATPSIVQGVGYLSVALLILICGLTTKIKYIEKRRQRHAQ